MLSWADARRIAAVAVAAVSLGVAGCAEEGETESPPSVDRPLTLQIDPPGDRFERLSEELLRESGRTEQVVAILDEALVLPHEIRIRIRSGRGDAFYDPRSRRVVFAYELFGRIAETFLDGFGDLSGKGLASRIDNVSTFILLHEVGHALIDVLELPITASEEDSVDNLATVLSIGLLQRGDNAALDFADFAELIEPGESPGIDRLAYWDEHSLDIQRANQTTCLVYGSDPIRNRALRRLIPEFRRARCRQEWKQISRSWEQLLEPHLQPGAMFELP